MPTAASTSDHDELAAAVRRWREETRYPTDADRQERDQLAELTRQLAPERLDDLDLGVVTDLITIEQLGLAPRASALVRALPAIGGRELVDLAATIGHLLWSQDDPADRFDRASRVHRDTGLPQLGAEVLRRLLSRAPGGWLPILDLEELERHARMLGLNVPIGAESTTGQRHSAVDAALQQRLAPWFGSDTAGMAAFLAGRAPTPPGTRPTPSSCSPTISSCPSSGCARSTTCWTRGARSSCTDLRAPARPTSPSATRRRSPTASRTAGWSSSTPPPATRTSSRATVRSPTDQGQPSYQLAPGPLARAARHATANPGRRHVLVIDEINRAHLPRVLGELLYLLEYRDHSITTLYRPNQPFRLPSNLLIIGTMNTADRSIAMIDAALCRRFHFVPLFPHEQPLQDLLGRWADANGLDQRWVRLLDLVNEELRRDLGGPDLQIGPSHLMRRGLYAAGVERIWTYSILPAIEDQLFGRADAIARYRWPAVLARLDRHLAMEVADRGAGPDDPLHLDADTGR